MSKFFEKTISSTLVYQGKLIGVREDFVELPTGEKVIREVVEHPGAVAIVAILQGKKLILVRQFRKATGEELLEIPAGLTHPGEPPAQAAIRELEEETGYRAKEVEEVFSGYASPGYSSEFIRFYLVTDLIHTKQKLEKDELIEVELVDIDTCFRYIKQGKIKDNKTIIGVMIAERIQKG